MSDREAAGPATVADAVRPTAGAMLRSGREAAGLTVEAAALQLKLAPRQVQALEGDDFAQLPGRTFVRGFIRNYARLLRLPADEILAALPDGSGWAMPAGSLAPSPQSMGELPVDARVHVNWVRWLIPLAMAAVVGVTAYYELVRPKMETAKPEVTGRAETVPAPAASSATVATGAAAQTPASASIPLANPLATVESPKAEGAKADGPRTDSTAPAPSAVNPTATKADSGDAASGKLGAAGSAAGSAAAPMVIDFRGTSWVQVKDGTGAILLSLTGNPGTTQVVSGTPPFDVVIGNIDAVTVTFTGKPVDLSMYSKQNVARMTLK